ncbi:MAG: lipopolysaccharide biosynthesis protein [Sphingobacteriia bacterium]|jgi:lipopolysaccharide biosynthesis protein|nr:glycoside hydrolase family 99-like domain-containing protein [Paludibacteraceae bacterium]NCA79099.1 lipopolysaccharide biosynthesis protein [Sphingobacteriia bacterium]
MARVIAFYLPQFHPIPENDAWWGKGFTEWTNVGRAKPLFRGHYQPRVPADLGYYDLRMPEVRQAQAELAQKAGIEAFCYYHYWFGNGKRLLERPFNEVLASGKPDFPFCLCWANHTWSNKTWEKSSAFAEDHVLVEQRYFGEKDYMEHFYAVLPAFKDKRYLQIDGKPIFVIYDPINFGDVTNFIELWRKLAVENGLSGIYFIGMTASTLTFSLLPQEQRKTVLPNLQSSAEIYNYVLNLGFDAVNSFGKRRGEMLGSGKYIDLIKTVLRRVGLKIGADKYDYAKTVRNYFVPEDTWENVFPTILPQWDRTARVGNADGVYINSTPEKFGEHAKQALDIVKNKQPEHQVIFLKSWNEWAEGNYMEPDLKYGNGYIEALNKVIG